MTPLLVALGAAVGAPLRYLTYRSIQARHRSVIPWGTLVVNVIASFVLGVLAGRTVSASAAALLGIGICGTLSTYSTFSYETMRLGQTGRRPWAYSYVALSLVAGVAVASLGWFIGTR